MGQKRLIMIVDDNVDAGEMTKMILERTGLYEVSVCSRGSEAFELIKKLRPELVLLDIVMPDADGTDVAAKIREEKSLAKTKIVFMTSLVSKQESLENSTIGGHPFISKPITGEALLQRVNGFFKVGN